MLYQALKYTWKINYTLGGGEIHGEQIEISLNFVHPCIGKLWLVVEAPVDFIPNGLRTNQLICSVSYPVLYLHDGSTWKAKTWSVHSSVFVDNENLIKWNLKNVCT